MSGLAREREERSWRGGVFNILHSSIRCSGAREGENVRTAEIIWSEQKQQSRSFVPSILLLSTSGNDSPLFPSLSAALIADRSSVQGRRPPESAERARVSTGHALKDQHSMMRGTTEQGGRADTIFARLKQVTQAEEASFHFGDDQSRTSSRDVW